MNAPATPLSGAVGTTHSIAAYALFIWAVAALLLLSGCASGPNANPRDPFEPYNRSMTKFNDGVDRVVLKPVATAYRTVTPSPVRMGVTNFFNNLEDAWSFLNSVVQLRPQAAAESLMRFSINTGLGLGGLLDIATEAGIERHSEDLGKTLGRWGMPAGPYVVLPLFGPSTVRDTFTLTTELRLDFLNKVSHTGTRNSLGALRLVDSRANLLRLGNLLDDAALDKYTFTRDAFLAKRRADVARSINNGRDDPPDNDRGIPDDKSVDPPPVEKKSP